MTVSHASDLEIQSASQHVAALRRTLNEVLFGQEELIDLMLCGVIARGHVLLEGLPGLGKTELVKGLSKALSLTTRRVQFTPDLLPGDITGNPVLQEVEGKREFVFQPGPIFTNLLLADEINRASPKTQSALLEAMQERRVTVLGQTHTLPEPFFVLATQNPIELEGTYPLPEAQLDRFMFEIIMEHLPENEELEVVRSTTSNRKPTFEHALTGPDIIAFQRLVRKVPVPDAVLRYALGLVRATRPSANGTSPAFIREWVAYGASVRAAQYLTLGAKARALMDGRPHVDFEDVKALVHPVLRHRILTNFHAESERVTTDQIIDQLVASVPTPKSGM